MIYNEKKIKLCSKPKDYFSFLRVPQVMAFKNETIFLGLSYFESYPRDRIIIKIIQFYLWNE
jgi:hypothetical protein